MQVSEYFTLGRTQSELDFINVAVDEDLPLFIDPFALSQRVDDWSQNANGILISYFDDLVELIRAGRGDEALRLMYQLREPNETRLGYSSGSPQGLGIGRIQAEQLYETLRSSTAVTTGFLNNLEECELLIEGIGRDKISDLTTNVIRSALAEYTRDQAALWEIPTQRVSIGPSYSVDQQAWVSEYFELPVADGRPILLVPKGIARYDPSYNRQKYYDGFIVDYLVAEHYSGNSALVHTLKNGTRRVYRKDVKAQFPNTKRRIYEFSVDHPEVLAEYREYLTQLEREPHETDAVDEAIIAQSLVHVMANIRGGSESASEYHNMMIGVIEFLFYPSLSHPVKEREIHEGRKRIDITLENAARAGIFERLHRVQHIPCGHVFFECKNYSTDIANPELDQIAGRFSVNRGQVGFICCRSFEDRNLFIRRCRDTFVDGRGLIVPIDDATVVRWLNLVGDGHRDQVERQMADAVDEITL